MPMTVIEQGQLTPMSYPGIASFARFHVQICRNYDCFLDVSLTNQFAEKTIR